MNPNHANASSALWLISDVDPWYLTCPFHHHRHLEVVRITDLVGRDQVRPELVALRHVLRQTEAHQ